MYNENVTLFTHIYQITAPPNHPELLHIHQNQTGPELGPLNNFSLSLLHSSTTANIMRSFILTTATHLMLQRRQFQFPTCILCIVYVTGAWFHVINMNKRWPKSCVYNPFHVSSCLHFLRESLWGCHVSADPSYFLEKPFQNKSILYMNSHH